MARIHIMIDDALVERAMRVAGVNTKREVVELGLQTLVTIRRQSDVRRFRGKLAWHGDLDAMRREE